MISKLISSHFAVNRLDREQYSALRLFRKFSFFLILLSTLAVSLQSSAIPVDTKSYSIVKGGLSEISDGAYIEGSIKKNGIQPDYYIDLSQEPLRSLLEKSASIGKIKMPFWDKVGAVVDLVQKDAFKYHNYFNPYYRRLLKSHRTEGSDIPLNDYLVCKAGVCREYALVLHFALKAAGISNLHGYAKIYRASRFHDFTVTEDHAFTVVNYKGTEWVVDAYYWGFNGFRLEDLMTSDGITENSPHAPIAEPGPGTRRIIKINSFPKIYNPKANSCSRVF